MSIQQSQRSAVERPDARQVAPVAPAAPGSAPSVSTPSAAAPSAAAPSVSGPADSTHAAAEASTLAHSASAHADHAAQAADAAAPRRPRRDRATRRRVVAPLLLGAVVLLVWEAVSRSGVVPSFFLPAPTAIAVRLVEDLTTGGLLGYVGPTLLEAALGCLAGAAVALPLGYAVFRSARAAAALEPYIAASQAVPAVALAPLLMLWLGYGLVPIVVLCALTVFFPILLATVLGLRTLDPDVVAAARLDGAGGWQLLSFIELPLALPALLTGLRNGFTLSVTGAVVGEFVMGGQGLGMLVAARGDSADTVGIFAALVVLCALAMSVYGLLSALERRLET
ncbi:ABC transporter permease [Georgenia daeguensis]|uniref:ABC transmembrane type-1 domain-containing protein n=1 Tax=Georgenia daeguensis TaxID=908355 RepID=A0ABP6UQU8_9MICO